MSWRRKKGKNKSIEYEDAELNIMPFIDVFSVLNSFLLFSAAFIALGMVRIYLPFLSNAQADAPPTRSFEVSVDATVKEVSLVTRYTLQPFDEQKQTFPFNTLGLQQLHAALVQVRQKHPDIDKVKVYTEDDIPWGEVIHLIDAVKLRQDSDPVFQTPAQQDNEDNFVQSKEAERYLFPKIVLGSVMLN